VEESAAREAFWKRHPGLIWSNPFASDTAHIHAALNAPRFDYLLDIAAKFGLERLESEWRKILAESSPGKVQRSKVERCLRNINEGFRRAAA
jgi:hypothetical protein